MRALTLFIALLPSLGHSQGLNWVNRFGGTLGGTTSSSTTTGDYVKEVTADINGNVIAIGYVAGAAILDITNQPEIATSASSLIIKFSSTGDFQWALPTGLNLNSVVTDADSSIFLAGYFTGTADFDPGAGEDLRTSSGGWDLAVIKLGPDGAYLWGYQAGTASGFYETANDCVIDNLGNVYVTGSFSNTCDFDNGPGINNLTGGPDDNLFILQLQSNGQLGWVRGIADPNAVYTQGYGIDIGTGGQLVVAGQVGSSGFSPIDINTDDGIEQYWNSTLAADNADVLVLSLNSDGSFIWGNTYDFDGYPGVDDWASVVDISPNGEVLFAGNLESNDPTPEMDPNLALSGYGLFLAKLSSNGQYIFGKVFNDPDGGSAYFSGIQSNDQGLIALKGYGSQTLDLDPGAGETFQAPNSSFILFLQNDGTYSSYMSAGANSQNITRAGEFVLADDGNLIIGGAFRQTFDFIPGADEFSLVSFGGLDGYVATYNVDACVGLSLVADYSVISCNNALVEIAVNGGSAPYSITWPAEIIPTDTYSGTTGNEGSLTIYVTDNLGCSTGAVVNINFEPFEITETQNDTLVCSGLAASFAVAPVTGVPPYTYIWDNDTTYDSAEFETGIAGLHSVVVTDALGCDAEMSFLAVNSTLALNPIDNIIEFCPLTPVTIGTEASGGTPPYFYSWGPYQVVFDTGTFVQTVVDALGCETSAIYTTIEYPDLTSMTLLHDPLYCNETVATPMVELTNALPPIEYYWDGIEGDESITFTALDPSGWHYVQAVFSDEYGCERSHNNVTFFWNHLYESSVNSPELWLSAPTSWQIDDDPETTHYQYGYIVTNRCFLPPHTLVLHNATLTNPGAQGYTTLSSNDNVHVYYHPTIISNTTQPNSIPVYGTGRSFGFRTNQLCSGTTMNPGDEFILIEAYVTFEDMLAYDNHYMPLVCSYDPNDMQASPMGVCASNYIEQDSLELTYTIRFQNYGNAPAGNVVILDTLGSMLDVSSFNFVGSSPLVPTIDLLEDSILQFTFNNINLPPISVDTLGSQGFVTFRIKTIENIQSGTVLNNRAAIYFDTNLPIITNTVTHTLVNELPDLTASLQTTDNGLETNIIGNLYNWYFCENDSLAASTSSPSFSPAASGDFYVIVQTDDCNYQSECTSFIGIHEATEQDILLFPNPTDDLINFYMPASKARTIRIMNNVGDQVAILNPKGSQISYDTSLLPAGVYFVEIEDIDGLGMRSRFVVLH